MIFSERKSDLDLTQAKVHATLNKLFVSVPIQTSQRIVDRYCRHKITSDEFARNFGIESIEMASLNQTNHILHSYSLFYSFCYDYYKFLPIVIALQGYRVTVLIEDRIHQNQLQIFNKLIKVFQKRFQKALHVDFLSHNEPHVIYKLKKIATTPNHKILLFVDGNKSNSENQNNSFKTHFKNTQVYFQQGFAMLNYILKNKAACGLLCKKVNQKLIIDTLDIIPSDPTSNKKEYLKGISHQILDNLDKLIQPDTIHKWDALVSVYQWFITTDHDRQETPAHLCVPFRMQKEYYVLDKETFQVYPIEKKLYQSLLKNDVF